MAAPPVILNEAEWRDRESRHGTRVRPWIDPRRERRARGRAHPVDDFLFDYYPYSASKLATWHPGHGTVLAGDAEHFLAHAHYHRVDQGITTDSAALAAVQPRLRLVQRLLAATADRAPQLGCFGMHEWAMVHGQAAHEIRHISHPLRITPERVMSTVDELGLRCTHIDAYRFFTPTSMPLNPYEPTRASQHEWEQPGCLHANMDLYKYAMWFSPYVGSDLVADCFELARDARELDMRAAPYDLVDLGYDPIRVESAEGRREYVDQQRAITMRAAPLRARLLGQVVGLLAIQAPSWARSA